MLTFCVSNQTSDLVILIDTYYKRTRPRYTKSQLFAAVHAFISQYKFIKR